MRNAGVWGGVAVLVYALVMFCKSFSLDYYNKLGPGPGFFPLWLSGLLIIFSILYIWESAKIQDVFTSEILPKDKKARQGILSTAGGLVFFLVAAPYVGFILPCSGMLFMMLLRDYKWYKALTASVIASCLLLVVFQKFLGVDLPVNSYGW